MPDTVRTFIALELPATAKQALAQVQDNLRAAARRRGLPLDAALKWVDPEGIHLTMVFLGNVDATLVPALSDAVETAGAGQHAARLSLSGLGTFPNARQPRVLWAGMAGEVDGVRLLQRRVQESLAPLGFVPEGRAFSPHLTLARVREQASAAERQVVSALVAAGAEVPALRFTADHLQLMKSTLHPAGARYEALHTVRLPA